jgi:hypothetical protein
MVHLHVPPSIRRLSMPRFVPGPGFRHVALEYDVAEALRPALVVDLGAGDGLSFFAYCQAMRDHSIDGVAYAIDGWAEPPAHPDGSVDAIRAHARALYPGISYVVPMPPPEALRHFSEGTIDLLRVDGTRSDVIAGADVEAWFRRVRPGGVVAWHGAQAAPGLWSLVAERCRSVVLSGGRGGIGIAMKPGRASLPAMFELLFEPGEHAALEALYAHVHAHHELDRLVTLANAPRAR